MTNTEYLNAILEQEHLAKNSAEMNALRLERDKVAQIITNAFEKSNPSIVYGGSKAKHTMIKSSYDLDIPVYFKHDDTDCGDSLEEIYNNVKDALSGEYFVVPKNSSLRLESRNGESKNYTHIDVVPGRRVSNDPADKDVFLHQNQGEKTRLKTNLETHVNHILNSGVRPEIKLAKVWKIKNNISVKTFVLELMIVKVLAGRADKTLEENIIYLLEQFRDNVNNISVQDPANSGNDLTPILNSSRESLRLAAASSLAFIDADMWTHVFGEIISQNKAFNVVTPSTAIPTVLNNPPQQWSNN
jgi:hypothetical protein